MNKFCTFCLLLILGQSANIRAAKAFLEGYAGGMFGQSKISCLITQNTYGTQGLNALFEAHAKKLSASATGGFKCGTWFKHRNTENVISWLDHIGCYLDTRFNNLEYKHRICSTPVCYCTSTANASGRTDICLSTKGASITLAFLLAGRWGFLATDTIPFGRLQPYLAVGPAGFFTHQKIQLTVYPHEVDGAHLTIFLTNPYTIAPQKKWICAPGCALDSGIRYIARKHLLFDFFFNYRFSPMRFNTHCTPQLCMKTHYQLFSFNVGIGYEF